MSRLVHLQIESSFAITHGYPTGAEIGYGLSEGWLSRRDAIEIALAKYKNEAPLSPAEEELALLLSDEIQRVDDLVDELQDSDESVECRARYWLYLALFWIWENRSEYADPLRVIEMLWADFEYPDEIRGLIGFMPPGDSEIPGVEGIELRWRRYLERVHAEYEERSSSWRKN
ncbi:DUF2247 family protein [Pseudonocardia spinosispora]|uniref:DUF2247 family protein n=1 Tax=Pseudonocardia spinosispora TaxID=103441 RepID=UPI0006869BE6|nr:DUF2247 family protein [Pseudonocardia spinosispora]